MPPLEYSHRNTTIVMLPYAGIDPYGELVISTNPTEIKVRWDDVVTDMRDPQGQKISVEAQMQTYEQVPIDSLILVGTIVDFQKLSASNITTFYKVVAVDETRALKGSLTNRSYGLMRYKQGATS